MIFAQYGYRNFHNENKNSHPIQPYHWDNWIKMVNENISYCKKFNRWKWFVFYFYVWTGRIRKSDVPSFHPYWKLEVNKDRSADLVRLNRNYEICKRDPSQIKIIFNKDTTLKDIEGKIIDCQNKINGKA